MESRIKRLGMREIITKVGFPITRNEFRNTYKFDVDLDKAIEFEKKLKQVNGIQEIANNICEYEEIFDKEIYVFHMGRLLEHDLESIKRATILGEEINQLVYTYDETGKNKRRFFVNAKELLRESDVIDIVMKKSKGEFDIYFSKDFIEQNTNYSENLRKNAQEKLNLIEKSIGLKCIVSYFKNSDLNEICRYSNLAILLIVNQEKLDKKIKKYIEYIDINKMLVLANAIYYYKHGENLKEFSEKDAVALKKFTRKVASIIDSDYRYLKTDKFDFEIDFNYIKEQAEKLTDIEIEDEELDIQEQEIEDEELDVQEQEIEDEELDVQEQEIEDEELDVEEQENENEELDVEEQENENEELDVQEQEIEDEELDVQEQELEKPELDIQKQESENSVVHNFINEVMQDENQKNIDYENRKKVIFKLDENYTQENFEDGTVIYYLPTKEDYIIDQMPNDRFSYGNAIYVITKEIFETQKENIINDRKLNQDFLNSLKNENKKDVVKIIHTGWENSLTTFFNIEQEDKYTKEDINNIKKIVDKMKK